MTNAPNTFWRSGRIDMSKSEMRSVAYKKKMYSIGPNDVKNALLNSSTQKSFVVCERALDKITKSASDVRNGLQTVEKMRATSVHTRGRTRIGSCGGPRLEACTTELVVRGAQQAPLPTGPSWEPSKGP
jgi:hypothetical protein